MNATTTLTWDAAVDAAMEPTDFDRAIHTDQATILSDDRIGDDGKLIRPDLIRERAAKAYIMAHEGERAQVRYTNPNHPEGHPEWCSRAIYTAIGVLSRTYVRYTEFSPDADSLGNGNRSRYGFVVGDTVVPFEGVCAINVEGQFPSVVTL